MTSRRRDKHFELMNAYDAAESSLLIDRFLRACNEPMDGARAGWAYSLGMLVAKKEKARLGELIRYLDGFSEPRQRAILRRAYFLKNDQLFIRGKAIADAEIAAEEALPQ